MPQWVILRVISTVLLCSIIVAPFTGCGKKVTSSTGEAASSSKGKSATAPVEKITPDTMATFPEEKSASTTIDTAREPVEAAPPMSSAGGGTEPGAAPSGAAPSGETLSLGDIFFDFDQHTIRRDAQSTLSANAAWINGKPGKAVVIEGHCDERGTQAYNLVLGEKRARSTKRYLEDLGVPGSRLKTTSYGELRPFCKERDENCYQQNRRAHFVVQ
ncbi:MAG TPA: OmpA family protein [Nitrospira sp.]|nr:OmpA family protein [Nitrospira sp.]